MDRNITNKYPEITEFFVIFSRMEYALKAEGFLISHRDAKADWISFAANIENQINEKRKENGFKKVIDYILTNPPKVQINENGIIKWEPRSASQGNDIKDLFTYIKRIRNNLFHGDKFSNGVLEDFDRDLSLVRSALVILKEAIKYNSDVAGAFYYNFNIP